MRKKFLYWILVFLALQASGCATLPKKFIRKKPKPEHTPAVVYLEQGPYQKKFSNEYYYKEHYTLWKTWQNETLDDLGNNSKRLRRSSQEAYSHLEQMGKYLQPEKQTQLKPVLDEMGRFMDKFQANNYSTSEEAAMRTDLERIKRSIMRDFYYEKVKSDLLPDNVDLGQAAPGA